MEKYNRKNFDITKGIGKVFAIWCDTKDKAVDFINFMADNGYKWCDGILERKTHWDKYKENTCYILYTDASSVDAESCIYIMSLQNVKNNNDIAQYIPGAKKSKIVIWEE